MSPARRRQLDQAGREIADAIWPGFLKTPHDLTSHTLALQRELGARLGPISTADHLHALKASYRRMVVLADAHDRRKQN